MTGGSWGGFNGLQVAARRPPALKAIATFYASDDRYADDVHYRGGCVLGMDMLQWATCMLAFNAKPPDPANVGRGVAGALAAPARRDAAVHRAVARATSAATPTGGTARCARTTPRSRCPVLAVGGWVDGYTDAVPRLLEHLQVPRRGIIGPWGHVDAVDGAPGPNVGMLQELVRWFGHWLRGDENGAMDGPMLRAYVQEWNDPATRLDERPGRWVGVANGRNRTTAAARSAWAIAAWGRSIRRRRSTSCAACRPPASTPAPGAPTATPTTCRPTSGPTTGAR